MPVVTKGSNPLYQGIVNDIRQQIRERLLMPGDRILSIGQLAERYGVSAITAKRAVAELQASQLVRSVQGKGTFVAGGAARAQAPETSAELTSVALMTNNIDAKRHRSFFTQIWGAIEHEVESRGLEFRVQVIPDGGVDFHVDLTVRQKPTEGLIFLAPSYPYNVLHIIQDRTMPVVMVDSTLSFANCVVTDNLHGMSQLIDHLRELGHRRLYLGHRHPNSPNATNENERATAFQFLTEQQGLKGEVGPADDYDQILARVKARNGPTAVLFTQDDPALFFREHAEAIGMNIPKDISICGFDGWSNHIHGPTPGLTTLAVDMNSLGTRAVEMLIELSKTRHKVPNWSRVRGKLVVDQTTAAPRRT